MTTYGVSKIKGKKIALTSVDHNPEEIEKQLPLKAHVVMQLSGSDREDYYLANLDKTLTWNNKPYHEVILAEILPPRKDEMIFSLALINEEAIQRFNDGYGLCIGKIDVNKSQLIAPTCIIKYDRITDDDNIQELLEHEISYAECELIVEYCDKKLKEKENDADILFLKSMAEFRMANLMPTEYAYDSYLDNSEDNNTIIDKLCHENADKAFETYKKAIKINPEIKNRYPNVKIVTASCFTGLRYTFFRPVDGNTLEYMLKNFKYNENTYYMMFTAFFIALLILYSIIFIPMFGDEISWIIVVISVFTAFYITRKKIINNRIKYDDFCKIEWAEYWEIK